MFFTQLYSKIATENVTKNYKKSIGVFHSDLLQNSHWKCHKNSKKYIVFFSQLVSKIAIGNVTKYSKKSIADCKRATGIYFVKTSSAFCDFFFGEDS